jgi:hypothetical protein
LLFCDKKLLFSKCIDGQLFFTIGARRQCPKAIIDKRRCRMRNKLTWFGCGLLALAIGVLAGCAHIPGGIAASSTPLEGRKYTVLGHAEASDNYVLLLGFLPVSSPNTIRRALEKACVKAGGDALIDVTVECHAEYWILFFLQVTTVEGTAIRFNN